MIKLFSLMFWLIGFVQITVVPVFAARPFTTDDAGTVETDKFELETAYNYWNGKAAAIMSFKHGITERMDIGIGQEYCILPEDQRAFSGANIGLKFALVPDLFSTSFGSTLGSNTYNVNAILSKSLSPVSFDANLGYQIAADTNNADLSYGFAAVYEYKQLCMGVEIGGTREGLIWWQSGIRFLILEWVQIDAGLGGNYQKSPYITATTGLWFTFPLTNNVLEGK